MIGTVLIVLAQTTQPVAPTCEPGVYLVGSQPNVLKRMTEQVTDHRKVSGMPAFMLLGGFTSLKVKTVLPGKAATLRVPAGRPRFVFCFDVSQSRDDASGSAMAYVGASAATTSPREFRLVRFDVVGDQRETPLTAMSVTGPKAGPINKAAVRFDVEEIAPGHEVVVPRQDLEPGEYGFLRTVGNMNAHNTKRTPPERVFDFAVD